MKTWRILAFCELWLLELFFLTTHQKGAPEMLNLPIFVGIDYHTHTLQICVTAITMRALIGQFDRFRTGKQLAHFCAVCPRNNSTGGKMTTGGLIKAGDELLRQVLVETAHRLIRCDNEWKAMATRLKANGKKACVVVAAVANRWIRRLFYQMTSAESSGNPA